MTRKNTGLPGSRPVRNAATAADPEVDAFERNIMKGDVKKRQALSEALESGLTVSEPTKKGRK